MSSGGSSIRVDRVAAVAATLRDGREQLGSGYLVSGRLVLTAEHCTRDKVTGEPAARLRVVRASDGAMADVADLVPDRGLDVAVLRLADGAPWDTGLPPPAFARVDQSQSGVLDDCTGIGFALFQRDPARRTRHTSEFHGRIYQTDERESGRLLMREPLIHPGPVSGPGDAALSERGEAGPSPWGGLSGALLFYRGSAIGVVVEHHPRQGDSALRAIGFEQIAASAEIRQCLSLPGPDSLPWVSEQAAARLVLAGWPLAEVRDPFAVEVHRPVQPEDPPPGLPTLPTYVPREHDASLARVVRTAAGGSSGIAVLVGGSSTGKTRACWEALQLLRDRPDPWRLWHPIDPTRPDAALRELPSIGPRTVVWLNEAQLYLDVAEGGLGEQVAAGLRELLRNPAHAPILVLATLWPQFWDGLTARLAGGADAHAQARELLAGHDIPVTASFTQAQLQRLAQAGDARLAQAAAAAQDGQVIQFLAGAPELLARYRYAPPAAAALIYVAMDARRLGMGIGLPHAFLAAAAPGYLTDAEWDAVGEDWLEQALAYMAVPCKGVRGPLTRIRPRPARSRAAGPGPWDSDEPRPGGQASIAGVPLYRLADYLDQHGRHHRKSQVPPASFWAAAAGYAFPGDQATLGQAAHARGLYRDAAQLYKNVAAYGDPQAARYVIRTLYSLHPADHRPAHWAVAHVALDDPWAVAGLLDSLREAGANEQIAALLHRDPAAHVSLDSPGVGWLLYRLREAGANEQAAALADRAVAHISLDDPRTVAGLLGRLREAGANEQVAALLRRDPAAHAPLDDPDAVAALLGSLQAMGANEQVTALLRRDPAAHVSLDDPYAVALLLNRWLAGGRREVPKELIAALADRAAAHISLDDPRAISWLLNSLRQAGANEQIAALLRRDPAAHAALDNPDAVAALLGSLQAMGANEQVTALLRRDPAAHAALDDPRAVADLLISLRKSGANEQVTALLRRDPAAHAALDDPWAVDWLLYSLRQAGANEQIAALLRRDPAAHVSLDSPGVGGLLGSLREAGANEQIAALADRASRAALDDPDAVAALLRDLRNVGANEQIAALLRRDPAAHVSLDDPVAVAILLSWLPAMDAKEQVTALAGRAAAHVSLNDPRAVADLIGRLQEVGAKEQAAALADRAAVHAALDDSIGVGMLLGRVREAGAKQQAAALADRLPGAGQFEVFREQEGRQDRFRFGREPDGSPAEPWGWEDLD